MNYVYLLILLGTVIALCMFINRATEKLKIPSLLLFIGLGMCFGVNGLLKIDFSDYQLTNVICSVCLIFVIFYGGFGTNVREAKPALAQALLLSSVGTAITAGLVGVFVYYCFNLFIQIGWIESMLIGSVIASTDAASVFNILRSRKLNLKYGTSSLLEVESGSNDPASYILTLLFVSMLAGKDFSVPVMLLQQVGFGLLFGAAFGFLAIAVLKKISFNMGQSSTIFVFAIAILAYAVPQIPFLNGNGYLSAYVCGILIGNARIRQKRDFVHFFDAVTGVAQMLIFFLLGLLVTPVELPSVLLPALLIFLFMTLIARPVAVAGILLPFRAHLNQIGVVSWAGLRGVASIVFAIVAVSELGTGALPYNLFNLVFCIVIISIAVQGSLLPPVSKAMRMLGDNDNVLRTFTDFSEESDVSFVKVVVGENHPWAGKKLRQCVMPREFLVVLILRGNEVIVPNGETTVGAGDVLVTAAPEFENNGDFGMYEEFIGKNHAWIGKTVRELELPRGALIAMIKRGGGTVIPYGATDIRQGDSLVCIKIPPSDKAETSEPGDRTGGDSSAMPEEKEPEQAV